MTGKVSRWDGKGFTSLIIEGATETDAIRMRSYLGFLDCTLRQVTEDCYQLMVYGKKRECARLINDVCETLGIQL